MSRRSLSISTDGKRIGMNAEYTTSTTEFVVDSPEVDFFDAELSEKRGAHDTRLNRYVENALLDDRFVNPLGWMAFLTIWIEVPFASILVALVRGG